MKTFSLVGVPIAAGIINFVVLTSAASACNSGLFSTSRILFNLSSHGDGPVKLAKLNKNRVPGNALVTSALVLSGGALLSKLIPEQAFGIVTTISAICFIWVWSIVLISHLRYSKSRPDLRKKSLFKAPLTPFMNYVVLALFVFILIIMLLSKDTRLAILMTPIWFILLLILYSLRNSSGGKIDIEKHK